MHECAYLANFFGHYRTDPLPNQLVLLNNIKQLSHGVANLLSIGKLHPTDGFEQRPLFEDVITNLLNFARRRILLLVLEVLRMNQEGLVISQDGWIGFVVG